MKLQPEAILQVRWDNKDTNQVADVLVQWKGFHIDDATWESSAQITASFPEFNQNLEDNVLSKARSIDEIENVSVGGRKSTREKRINPKYRD